MTGYGQAAVRVEAGIPARLTPVDLSVELRSVNGRFLDLSFRLPDELRGHESALRERIGARIKRGKVECRANLGVRQSGNEAIDPQRLAQVLELQAEVIRLSPQAGPLSASELLRWPGVLASEPMTPAWAEGDEVHVLSRALESAADQAIDQFLAARAREGARLAAFLIERCALIERLAQDAALLAPQAIERQQQRLLERFAEAWALAVGRDGALTDEGAARERALAEATAYAIKIDIAEEIGRLKSHTAEIRQLLARGGELGKRLDFQVQELHREANTLGSKSAGLELTQVAIDLKVAIEQMREQVQNLE